MTPKRISTSHPEIFLHPNGIYYARIWMKGRWNEKSLKTKNFSEAKENHRVWIRKFDPDAQGDGARIEDLYPLFMADKNKLLKNGHRRERTIEEYEQKWEKHLLPYFRFKKISSVTTEVWEKYVEEKSGMSLQHHRKIFGNFLRWCMKKGYLKGLPDLPIPKYKTQHGQQLTEEQLTLLFKNCQSLKLMLYCSLYLYCAMRSREITALEWERVLFERRAIYLGEEHTKNKKERWVPFNDLVFDLLTARRDELIAIHGKLPKWVFPMRNKPEKPTCNTGIYKSFNTAKENAGIDFDISPHDFRHTWTTEARNNPENTDANLEKFAGSSTVVQKGTYHHPTIEKLRPLADTIKSSSLSKVIRDKLSSRGSLRGRDD